MDNLREIAIEALSHGIEAVLPEKCISEYVEFSGKLIKIKNFEINIEKYNKINLIAFGKASVKMTEAFLRNISPLKPHNKIVIGTEKIETTNFTYIKAGHPIPDKNSIKAGKTVLELSETANASTLTFCLISGGGSSLLEYPKIPLEDIQKTNEILLNSGANIHEINCIRKHLSHIKGGALLKKLKGTVISLIISDVIGDSLDTISSGPTYFDNSTFSDAVKIFNKYDLFEKLPLSCQKLFIKGVKGEIEETFKKDEFEKSNIKNFIIGNNSKACKSIISYLRVKGFNVLYLGSRIQGEAKEVAKVLGGIAMETFYSNINIKKPVAIVSGGETTVKIQGNGKGGRNQELALAMIPFISHMEGIFLSAGTDGIDGVTDAAGATVDNTTAIRAEQKGLIWENHLKNNDSYNFFHKLNDLLITGATGTNVADVQIFLIK